MRNLFNIVVIALALLVSFAFYHFVMGNPANFKDGERRREPIPGNVLGTVYTGGPLVAVLIALSLISITFVFERTFSIRKARGRRPPEEFLQEFQKLLEQGNFEAAITLCSEQSGSLGNILRAGLQRYRQVEKDSSLDAERKLAEVQRALDEAMNLETPLLEKNLVILSTIASISTLVGLLGTTIGMIRAFMALGLTGAVSAQQLSIGIAEALYNTAGGLAAAIISIVAYNFFTTKVDNFVYTIDEATLSMMEILTVRVKQ
ncbi:MAG: MotA/TolQ/ExbB proton channel family protein [Candidatus Kapabacteria bacterium]|nr:MotA/TolQ/ExbB proton channel family protein [Candidatus Kapabacteria bacterium]MDW8225682.1 MotA/TolQ/ExbB proton channel family protein [Bacteroidota bacterium]